jgi:methyl coenzyme M reductase subunit D
VENSIDNNKEDKYRTLSSVVAKKLDIGFQVKHGKILHNHKMIVKKYILKFCLNEKIIDKS